MLPRLWNDKSSVEIGGVIENVGYVSIMAVKTRWLIFIVLFGLQALGYLSVRSLRLILIGWPSHFYFNYILAPLFDIAPLNMGLLNRILFFLGSFGIVLYFAILFYAIGFIVEKVLIFIKMKWEG